MRHDKGAYPELDADGVDRYFRGVAEDLGQQLIQAGLVTRHQLAQVLGTAPAHEGALVAGLVQRGLSEDGLAGFFLAAGLGPLMHPADLAAADPAALAKVPAAMAAALLALPVRDSVEGLIVAMAAPSDAHAVRELSRAAGAEILPTVARVGDLLAALDASHPGLRSAPAPVLESEPPVLVLVRPKVRSDNVVGGYFGSTRGADRVEARATVGPRIVADEAEGFMPLVRRKAILPPPATRRDDKPASEPPKPAVQRIVSRSFPKVARDAHRKRPPSDLPARIPGERPQTVPGRTVTAQMEKLRPGRRERRKFGDTADFGQPRRTDAQAAEREKPREAPGLAIAGLERDTTVTLEKPPQDHPPPEGSGAEPSEDAPRRSNTIRAPAPPPGAAAQPGAVPVPPRPDPAVADPPSEQRAEKSAFGRTNIATRQRATDLARGADQARDSRPVRSIIPDEHERWGSLSSTENKIGEGAAAALRDARPPRPSKKLREIGGTLRAIRASRDRDEVVELACQGTLTVARAGILLALRKSVLKGWGGAGPGVSVDAVRNLWIPTSSPSMFREVVATRRPYHGPTGRAAADGLFRAALGSRGGRVSLHPIVVGDKLVGVLAADDMRFGDRGRERVETLARAVSDAFERIIVSRRR